jgi:predicted DNA-binding transcriptional regulator YafY
VRAAFERAWFEQQPLRITYVDGNFVQTTRDVRIQAVVMDRHETRIDAIDLGKGERRQFRLDRIARAEVLEVADPRSV